MATFIPGLSRVLIQVVTHVLVIYRFFCDFLAYLVKVVVPMLPVYYVHPSPGALVVLCSMVSPNSTGFKGLCSNSFVVSFFSFYFNLTRNTLCKSM